MADDQYHYDFPDDDPYYGVGRDNEIKSSMFTCQGLDTSSHQGCFDFGAAVKQGKIKFCFARASIGYGDEDEQFARSWGEMAHYNILRGAYHAAWPESAEPGKLEQKAADEAKYFCELVLREEQKLGVSKPGWGGDVLPLGLDYEQKTPWSPEENRSFVTTWLRTAQEQLQRGCILYTGDGIWGSDSGLGGDDYLTDFPLWVAHYSNGTVPGMKPWDRWALWQWSGGEPGDIYYNLVGEPFPGVVSGNNVDINAYGGSLEMLRKLGNPRYDKWLLDDEGTIGCNPYASDSLDPMSKWIAKHRRHLRAARVSIDRALDDLQKLEDAIS